MACTIWKCKEQAWAISCTRKQIPVQVPHTFRRLTSVKVLYIFFIRVLCMFRCTSHGPVNLQSVVSRILNDTQ